VFAPFTTAAKEEMFSPWCADPALAADLFPDETRMEARADKGEKSHQGFFGKSALSPGIAWSNSTSALGLRSLAVENRVRSRCTGKERDAESGLDNFGARYNASSIGRFMTPDSGADETLSVPVPFAELRNPQSLNLYSYVRNNPLRYTDPDGQNVRVCVDNGNCFDLTDQQYQNLYNQQNGQQGINLPGGTFPNGSITCGGASCGSATYYEPGLIDESPGIIAGIVGGKVAGAIFEGIGSALGKLFGSGTGETVGEVAGQSGAKVLLSGGTKQAAKDVVEGLADGAQKASAKRAIAAATRSESVSISESADGTLSITRTRPGFDGSQTFTKTIDSAGNSETVQTAHDAAGNLVHYDPKN